MNVGDINSVHRSRHLASGAGARAVNKEALLASLNHILGNSRVAFNTFLQLLRDGEHEPELLQIARANDLPRLVEFLELVFDSTEDFTYVKDNGPYLIPRSIFGADRYKLKGMPRSNAQGIETEHQIIIKRANVAKVCDFDKGKALLARAKSLQAVAKKYTDADFCDAEAIKSDLALLYEFAKDFEAYEEGLRT